MKKLILTTALLGICTTTMFAQKYMTRTARVSFDATAPSSPEQIDAVTNEAVSIIDAKTGAIAFQVLIKGFKFQRALMQEHFNEKYMESDKYPKSDLKGTIANLSDVNFSKDGAYNVKVTGKLTIHGVTNDVSTTGTITVKGTSITLKSALTVKLEDYKISVPSVVSDKVGKEAKISIEGTLAQSK